MSTQKSIIPKDGSDGFLKNISELVEEYRNDGLECFCLVYKRKRDESMRTYFINPNDPNMLSVLIRLLLDMSGQYSPDAMEVTEFE